MARWIFLLPLIFFYTVTSAAETCEPRADLFALKPLNELQNHTCEEVKNSRECQTLYADLKAKNEDVASKALQCKDRGQMMRVLEQQVDMRLGCALGGWNFVKNTFVDLGTAIGEGTAKLVLGVEKAAEYNAKCDRDLSMKRALYSDYNTTAPTLLRVNLPSDEVLYRTPCSQLSASLMMAQNNRAQAATLRLHREGRDSPEAKEYIEWQKKIIQQSTEGPSLIGMAKAKIDEMGIKLECYNTVQASAMICEAIANVATVAAGPAGMALKAAKVANIAKIAGIAVDAEKATALAGVAKNAANVERVVSAEKTAQSAQKVEDFVDKVKTADRRGAGGAGQQLTNQSQKDEILNLSGSMTNRERVAAFEELSGGRKLTTAEAAQLQKMHDIGTSQGRTYATLTDADLKAKAKLASEINPATGKAYFSKEETNILMRNGITGSNEAQRIKDYEKYSKLASENDYSQYYRLHAESSNGLGKAQEAEAAYKKAYSAYVKEKKVDFSNPTTARQKLTSMSENELYQLEDLSAITGNTEKLADVTRAKWSAIEKDIRNQYRSAPGGSSPVMENTVQSAYQDLKMAARSSDPLTKKAAEEKIKAMKVVFPGLK